MTVTAVFKKGVFEPTEPQVFPEGTPALVEVFDQPAAKPEPENSLESASPTQGARKWGLGYVTYVADDFDATPPEFEEYM